MDTERPEEPFEVEQTARTAIYELIRRQVAGVGGGVGLDSKSDVPFHRQIVDRDAVSEIRRPALRNPQIRDTVSGIRPPAGGGCISALLVPLRPSGTPDQINPSPGLLRDRSAPRRMDGPSARPADRVPVLRAHCLIPEQGSTVERGGEISSPRLRGTRGGHQGEAIKDPYVLEFLGLRDEYSESDLEQALIHHLESFLLELGGEFAFVARQKRLRIGNEWYRVDLVFFHRGLRCLVLIDLKLGRFTHADAGQMHLYLNYACEHWTRSGENPPVGLILCAQKDSAVARYALDGLPNKVMAAEYRTALPDERVIAEELERTRRLLDQRRSGGRLPDWASS